MRDYPVYCIIGRLLNKLVGRKCFFSIVWDWFARFQAIDFLIGATSQKLHGIMKMRFTSKTPLITLISENPRHCFIFIFNLIPIVIAQLFFFNYLYYQTIFTTINTNIIIYEIKSILCNNLQFKYVN